MPTDLGQLRHLLQQVFELIFAHFLAEVFLIFLSILMAVRRWRRWMMRAARYLWLVLRQIFNRASVVLVYADLFDETATSRLGKQLDALAKTPPYDVMIVNDSEALLSWPLSSRYIKAIVVLITDVTKLGSSRNEIDQLQERLIAFCKAGGILILGHDVLYRRAGNAKLQALAGSKIASYLLSTVALTYKKATGANAASGDWFDALPAQLTLDDGELLISTKWRNDAKMIYLATTGGQTAPTVVMWREDRGVAFWINCGDKSDDQTPKSIVTPESAFVTLLNALIQYRA